MSGWGGYGRRLGAGNRRSLGPAITGHPWRHSMRSMSITRRLFNSSAGFSRGRRRSTAW
jgi:hypothetical protein